VTIPPLQSVSPTFVFTNYNNISTNSVLVEPEIIEISSDSDSNSPISSHDSSLPESINLLLQMLSTHLSCSQHPTTSRPSPSTSASNLMDLPTLISFLKRRLPSDYPQSSKMGYTNKLSEQQCSQLFCGLGSGTDEISTAKLSVGHATENYPIDCFYDIDSFIVRATSLAVAKNGIRVQFCPNQRQNITQDLHLRFPITETLPSGQIRFSHIPLHHIPHFRLGTLSSTIPIPLYIFLPQLYHQQSSSNTYLSNQTLEQWMDSGFLPSLHKHYSSDIVQHLPPSFESAYLEIYARSREDGIQGFTEKMEKGRRQEIHYYLPADKLEDIWTDLHEFSLKPGFNHFQNMFLLLDAKDLKLITKAKSPKGAGERFWNTINQDINSEYLDSEFQYLDLGQEIISSEKSRVLLFKRCCIDYGLQQLKKSSKGLKSTIYSWALSSLAANKTVEYSRTSKLHQEGYIYCQSYSPLKSLFDAAGTYPFQNSSLEYLSMTPELIKAWQSSGPNGMGIAFDIKKLEQSYLHSRDRILIALKGASKRDMSFGVRQEHRLSSKLFNSLCQSEDRIQVYKMSNACWNFNNQEIFQFLEMNFLRFSLGLECSYHSLQSSDWATSKDISRIFRIFFHLQKASFTNVLLEANGDIWRDKPLPTSKKQYPGLGIQRQLKLYNIAWLPTDTISWNNWSLHSKYQNTAAFEFIQIHATALIKAGSLLEHKIGLEIVEQFGNAIAQINNPESYKTYRLLAYMGTMVIQRFRADVWTALARFCDCLWTDEGQLNKAKIGLVPLDYQNILSFNPARFARVQFSNKHKYCLQERWEILFHCNDEWEKKDLRKTWKNWPYRRFFQKSYDIILQTCGSATVKSWEYQLVQGKFARSNFLLPSPCRQSLLQRQTRKGQLARIYWVSLAHNSWQDSTSLRKLPQKDMGQDKWEYWEADYHLPIPEHYESPEDLYCQELEPHEMIKKVLKIR